MFNLDPQAAKAADVKSASIQSAGKYKGRIVCAEFIENTEKGSKNICIHYKTDAGQEAQFFINLIFNHNERNETGHKMLSAILACLKLRSTGNPTPGSVEKWSKLAQAREQVAAQVFPAMAGKEIGFLVQMEIEKKSETGYPRPVIYLPFEAATEKTASEVLAVPPIMNGEILAKAVQHIAERPLIDRRPKASAASAGGFGGAPAAAYTPDFDDDTLPF